MLPQANFFEILGSLYAKVSSDYKKSVHDRLILYFYSSKYPTLSEKVPTGVVRDFFQVFLKSDIIVMEKALYKSKWGKKREQGKKHPVPLKRRWGRRIVTL